MRDMECSLWSMKCICMYTVRCCARWMQHSTVNMGDFQNVTFETLSEIVPLRGIICTASVLYSQCLRADVAWCFSRFSWATQTDYIVLPWNRLWPVPVSSLRVHLWSCAVASCCPFQLVPAISRGDERTPCVAVSSHCSHRPATIGQHETLTEACIGRPIVLQRGRNVTGAGFWNWRTWSLVWECVRFAYTAYRVRDRHCTQCQACEDSAVKCHTGWSVLVHQQV